MGTIINKECTAKLKTGELTLNCVDKFKNRRCGMIRHKTATYDSRLNFYPLWPSTMNQIPCNGSCKKTRNITC